MCLFTYALTYVRTYVFYVSISLCMYVRMFLAPCTYTYLCMGACMYGRMRAYVVCTYVCVCMYVCMLEVFKKSIPQALALQTHYVYTCAQFKSHIFLQVFHFAIDFRNQLCYRYYHDRLCIRMSKQKTCEQAFCGCEGDRFFAIKHTSSKKTSVQNGNF
jgi:hypothetical protein